MKIALTGKGGVGKTTLASLLAYTFAEAGKRVIAVDADPDANLASALGVEPDRAATIRPIADMGDLIEERTGARPGQAGGVFKLNPRVDDIPEGFGLPVSESIKLLVMGKSKSASAGCYCPENVLLKRLLRHLIVERDEVVIVDMEAGIEHLTRGTSDSMDAFVVVVEPGQRSIQTAETVRKLAEELGIRRVYVVANKLRNDNDLEFVRERLGTLEILSAIPLDPAITEADMRGVPPHTLSDQAREVGRRLAEEIIRRAE